MKIRESVFPCGMSNGSPIDMEQFATEETAKLINTAGMILKCTFMTKVKALLIYHHFRACVGETEYNPHTTAAACINLSVKHNEEKFEMEHIILLVYSIIDPGKKISTLTKNFKNTMISVSELEIIILRMLEFDLSHAIAHQYLPYFMNDLREELSASNVWDLFSETCLRLACDFYLSKKCLVFKADEIAIAVIQASLYMIGIDCSYFKLRLKVLNNVDESKIQSIIEDIFSISFIGARAEKATVKPGGVINTSNFADNSEQLAGRSIGLQ